MLNLIMFSILSSLAQPSSPAPEEHLLWKVGEVAPHVHLPDITTGRSIDLENYRGKKLLLVEFASW